MLKAKGNVTKSCNYIGSFEYYVHKTKYKKKKEEKTDAKKKDLKSRLLFIVLFITFVEQVTCTEKVETLLICGYTYIYPYFGQTAICYKKKLMYVSP